jgi:UDP-glucose 6-dehydrogenase
MSPVLKNYWLQINQLNFTTNHLEAYKEADVIFIVVATLEKQDGLLI